jgi:hypothetical protein
MLDVARPGRRIWLRALLVALIASVALAVASCDRFVGIAVHNNTTVPLHFYVGGVNGAAYPLTAQVPPGDTFNVISRGDFDPGSLITRKGCTVGDLVALDPTGREVARKAPPLCADDTWTVVSP